MTYLAVFFTQNSTFGPLLGEMDFRDGNGRRMTPANATLVHGIGHWTVGNATDDNLTTYYYDTTGVNAFIAHFTDNAEVMTAKFHRGTTAFANYAPIGIRVYQDTVNHGTTEADWPLETRKGYDAFRAATVGWTKEYNVSLAAEPALERRTYLTEILADDPLVFFDLHESSGAPVNLGKDTITNLAYGPSLAYKELNRFGTPGAYKFATGNSTYVQWVNNPTAYRSKQFTIQFWMKSNGNPASPSAIGRWVGTATTGNAYNLVNQLNIASTAAYPRIGLNGAYTAYSAANTVANNQWHMWTFVSNGNALTLYIDNVNVGTLSNATSWATAGGYNQIGQFDASWDSGDFAGWYDDVVIYDKALTEERITAHYSAEDAPRAHVSKPGVFHGWSVPL